MSCCLSSCCEFTKHFLVTDLRTLFWFQLSERGFLLKSFIVCLFQDEKNQILTTNVWLNLVREQWKIQIQALDIFSKIATLIFSFRYLDFNIYKIKSSFFLTFQPASFSRDVVFYIYYLQCTDRRRPDCEWLCWNFFSENKEKYFIYLSSNSISNIEGIPSWSWCNNGWELGTIQHPTLSTQHKQ